MTENHAREAGSRSKAENCSSTETQNETKPPTIGGELEIENRSRGSDRVANHRSRGADDSNTRIIEYEIASHMSEKLKN